MLKGKIALVTGGGKGIGRMISKLLAENGAHVVINYNGSEKKAEETAAQIIKNGGSAETYQCNVADYEQTEQMMKAIFKSHKNLDILVNNAGITRDGLLLKMPEQDFNQVVDINLKGAFHTLRHAARQMLKQKSGKIINITSVVGIIGNAGQTNYAASKAGVIGLTKSAAKELASRGITVNAVAPGFIESDMTEVLKEDIKEQIKAQIPLGRFGSGADVAEMVVFLASGKADYITGQIIQVDGGMAM